MSYKLTISRIAISRKYVFLASFAILLTVLASSFAISGKVLADGRVGAGGNGTGGSSSGGYNTRNGHGWMVYDVNGSGPSGGFRNGTAWGSVQAACREARAGSVMLFGIENDAGKTKGYNYIQDYSNGHYTPGTAVDGGLATAVPTSWAQAAFAQLPSQGVSTAGFTFGGANGNVAWFCTGIDNVNHDPAGDAAMNCSAGFQGWALDADDLNARLGIVVVIKSPGEAWDTSNFKIYTTANREIPNPPFNTANLAVFGVTLNRGFTTPLPEQFKNGANHEWMVLAANAAGTPSNSLGFVILGQGNFNCPPVNHAFTISPKGQTRLLPDNEAPTQGQFTNVGATTDETVNGVVLTRKYVVRKTGQPDQNLASPPPATVNIPAGPAGIDLAPNPDVQPTPGLAAGDQVCVIVTASPGSGEVNAADQIVSKGADKSAEFCDRVVNKPYLSVYAGDVYAGGNFSVSGSACTWSGGITAYLNSVGYGSGTQLAATALGVISSTVGGEGFNSASLRASDIPTRPKGLNFANTPASISGEFGESHCIKNYFADAGTAGATPDLSTAASGDYTVNHDINLANITIPMGRHIRLFVQGKVTISGNIQFSNTTRSKQADIPSLQIIARNIDITNAAQVIDGLYVAQPEQGKETTQGIINTCVSATSNDELYGSCGNQLVINGAFVANQVKFRRTHGSLRNASGDQPIFGSHGGTCSGVSPGGAKPTCAGEVFNFTPEVYLAEPVQGGGQDRDEFYVVLPPVL